MAIEPLGTNFSEILIKIQNFTFLKMHLKILSAKWQPLCLAGDELKVLCNEFPGHHDACTNPTQPNMQMVLLRLGSLWSYSYGHHFGTSYVFAAIYLFQTNLVWCKGMHCFQKYCYLQNCKHLVEWLWCCTHSTSTPKYLKLQTTFLLPERWDMTFSEAIHHLILNITPLLPWPEAIII